MKKILFGILCMTLAMLVSCTPEENDPKPQVVTSARFSVGAGKYVQFSPGFLCYDTLAHEYHFAKSQLQASHRGVYDGHWVDEFVWGHGEDPLFDSVDPDDYAIFNDWGYYPIDSDAPGTWRTLTQEEWGYLLRKRPKAGSLFGFAAVDDVNGYFLLPDSWQDIADIPMIKGGFTGTTLSTDVFAERNQWSASQWQVLQEHGAVFFADKGTLAQTWTASTTWVGDNLRGVVIDFDPIYFTTSTLPFGYRTTVRLVKDYQP